MPATGTFHTVLIGIGTNLGNRERNVRQALNYINEKIILRKLSPFIETSPAEGASGGFFLNGAMEGETTLPPGQIVLFLQNVEVRLGRQFPREKNLPRIIDLDVLFCDKLVLCEKNLTIPHPKIRERRFVLQPLSKIAPQFNDPVSGKTIIDLLNMLK